ncbi:MAG: hypothetical protein K8S54_00620 [Spirochaetia bacterium]|nr:hypothetical protein [Spirochaetia bacterium]
MIRYTAEGSAANEAIEASMKKLFVQLGKPAPPGPMLDSVKVVQECAYTFEANSSWPERVECSTKSNIAANGKDENRAETMQFLRAFEWKALKDN